MTMKSKQQIVFEDVVTSRVLHISILNYVTVVYNLQHAIKVSDCDDNDHYFDKCFRLEKRLAIAEQVCCLLFKEEYDLSFLSVVVL